VLAAAWLARLPWELAAQARRRRFGLSNLSGWEWITAPWLELLGTAAFLAAALAAGIVLARRLGPRWWLPGGAVVAALGAAAIALGPLLQSPRLEPLAAERLAAGLTELAARMGVDVGSVEVLRASERTTRANAEVAGLGPTKRVILWDTLLDGRYTDGEVRFVVAHELAHAQRAHLWKGAAWVALLGLPLALAVALATRPAGGLARPAAVPFAALALALAQLAALPVGGAISRRYEAEADRLALEATRDPDAARALYVRLAETNLAQPRPPLAWRLLSTHPSLAERVATAEAWDARTRALPASPAGS
jgi:STE24 endopeptidase